MEANRLNHPFLLDENSMKGNTNTTLVLNRFKLTL
jgi:hypothetical protein